MRLGTIYPFDLNGGHNFSEIQYIESGIQAFLDIRFFELFHKPFGVDLEDLLFDSRDIIFLDRVELVVADALKGYDPISLRFIQFDIVEGNRNALRVNIFYVIRSSGEESFYSYLLDKSS